jgi:hypothetical protein
MRKALTSLASILAILLILAGAGYFVVNRIKQQDTPQATLAQCISNAKAGVAKTGSTLIPGEVLLQFPPATDGPAASKVVTDHGLAILRTQIPLVTYTVGIRDGTVDTAKATMAATGLFSAITVHPDKNGVPGILVLQASLSTTKATTDSYLATNTNWDLLGTDVQPLVVAAGVPAGSEYASVCSLRSDTRFASVQTSLSSVVGTANAPAAQ